MEIVSLESFIQCHAKPFQPRSLKFASINTHRHNPQPNPYEDSISKNRSSSVHDHNNNINNNNNSVASFKLPSLYKNNLKYFLKEASVKEMKRQNYDFKLRCIKNPAYIMYIY